MARATAKVATDDQVTRAGVSKVLEASRTVISPSRLPRRSQSTRSSLPSPKCQSSTRYLTMMRVMSNRDRRTLKDPRRQSHTTTSKRRSSSPLRPEPAPLRSRSRSISKSSTTISNPSKTKGTNPQRPPQPPRNSRSPAHSAKNSK